jgi:hypothetical protein
MLDPKEPEVMAKVLSKHLESRDTLRVIGQRSRSRMLLLAAATWPNNELGTIII